MVFKLNPFTATQTNPVLNVLGISTDERPDVFRKLGLETMSAK